MRTNNKLIASLVVSTCLGIASASAQAQQVNLKISDYLPPGHGINTDFIKPWTEDISACTNGEVTFNIYPGGTQFGNIAKQQEQVLAGVIDIAVGLNGIPRGRFSRTSIIGLPFLTRDAGAASQALWDLYPEYLKPEYKGLKVLALFAHNGGLIHTADKKVETMKDLKGLRLRTPSPAISEMLTYLGATPQGLPPGQVYQAVQKGVIDGTVFPWDPIASFGLNEVLDYHLDAGVYTVPFFFVMNQRKFDSLPEDAQACIDKFSGQTLISKFGPWWDKWDAVGSEEAKASGDVITTLSPEERDHWREALQPMITSYLDDLEASGVENATEIYHQMQNKIAEYENTHADEQQ